MQNHPTPARPNGLPPAVLALALAALVTAGVLLFWPWSTNAGATQPHGSVDALDGDPYFVTPKPTPEVSTDRRQLRLELALPPLSDEQLFWQRSAEIIVTCPLCRGIDKPPIPFSDDERAIFVALLFTESHLLPYADTGDLLTSEAGCRSISQVCGSLLTFESADNPMLAIYVAGDYLAQLLEEEDHDYLAALKRYKGIDPTDPETQWQADTVLQYIRLRGGK